MTTVKNLLDCLDAWAPIGTRESWDNAGLLVGREGAEVSTVLIALDISPKTIAEAKYHGAELIVSHHPVVLDPISSVRDDDIYGMRVLSLAENRIAAICMHTNLDFADGGVDDALADALGLYCTEPLTESGEGRISRHRTQIPLTDLLFHVKHSLGANGLRYYDSDRPAMDIATCCGAGGDLIGQCVKKGCDTLITGDLKYFHFVEAEAFGLNLIDAGHFATENVIVPVIAERIKRAFPELKIFMSGFTEDIALFYM